MRSALRWLILLIPILLFLLVLGRITSLDSSAALYEHLPKVPDLSDLSPSLSQTLSKTTLGLGHNVAEPGLSEVKTTHEPEATAAETTHESGDRGLRYALWKHWSKIIHDDRPQAPAISLRHGASTLEPAFHDKIRRPYINLVTNSQGDLDSLATSHKRFLEELENDVQEKDTFWGKGIVVVGGGEYFGPAIIGIYMLRRTGSQLPVEVFVPNEEEYNKELCESYLIRLNARCVILSDFTGHGSQAIDDLKLSHYQYKALALLFSSFSDVLLLDSDSIPLIDPEKELFASEPYTSSGLVIWPDFWVSTESTSFYTIAGLLSLPNDLPSTSSETGQLLINKTKHLKTLLLIVYYNVFGPDYYYPLLSQGALGQGDKETFMAAAVALEAPYYRVKKGVEKVDRHTGRESKGTAMVQFHAHDDWMSSSQSGSASINIRPAFLHSNTPKMNAGHLIDEGDLFSANGDERIRLLGSKKEQMERFGVDLEQAVWELLVQTGCELAGVIREWKPRKNMCERLKEHFDAVFGK